MTDATITGERKETLLRRVQKLLALARNNPNQHEAAAAAAQAQTLLLAHKLSVKDLGEVKDARHDPLVDQAFDLESRADTWKVSLAGAVARGYQCQFCYQSARYGSTARIYYVGRQSDVEVAWYVYGYLANVLNDLAPKAFEAEHRRRVLARDYDGADRMQPRKWQNDFRLGAIAVLGRRLREGVAEFASANPNARAVVLASQAEVAQFFKTAHPKLRSGGGGRGLSDGRAYEAGQAAGAAIELRRGLGGNGGGPKALPHRKGGRDA